ncbi:unnamed protein product [Adineta steineri]|uniref:NHL repeat containing protein n=1 Tax=Adineta steineri TaxID=433720 RepID=A0A813XW35_9BILA|nr:unnamed protein product [Adineta steineri]CAF1093780.1 unnamed protein product [Adineta steineri]CAF1274783.1 unnamed protein product [Adineta steineri]CAF1583039.1 unnamed protein product [Adineta steineri]
MELATKRATTYDALPEHKSESENKNNIKQSTRPQIGSKIVFCFSIAAVMLILITIISITIWFISIKIVEPTINTTTATIDASTTGTTILATSTTTTTKMLTTSITETTMLITSTNSHTITKNVSKFNKWKQYAITVAGGNGYGEKLNQLRGPAGIFIDKKKNVFIADGFNHRIVEWRYNTREGQTIAGGNKQVNRTDQLNYPTDVIVDEQNHSIIIADYGNRRVIQWMNQSQQILIENIYCFGLAINKNAFLYVSNHKKNEVRRWKMSEYNNEGIVVAGGNGQGNQLNQLSFPNFIFVDEDQSVYVSDSSNNRVMKWKKGAKEGQIVAGGNGYGENLNQLSLSEGVVVDDFGQIYVIDWGNDRVMRWCEGKEEGEIIVGGNGQGNQSNQLYYPRDLSFDDEENLYVADSENHRIQKFEIIL